MKHGLVTLVVIMILDTTAFQVLFIVFLFCARDTSLLWRSTVAFTYLKVKSAKCILFISGGLGLGLNLFLFTSLVFTMNGAL